MIVASVVAGGGAAALLGSAALIGVAILAALAWTPPDPLAQLENGVVPQTRASAIPGTADRAVAPGGGAEVARVSAVEATSAAGGAAQSPPPIPPSAEGRVASVALDEPAAASPAALPPPDTSGLSGVDALIAELQAERRQGRPLAVASATIPVKGQAEVASAAPPAPPALAPVGEQAGGTDAAIDALIAELAASSRPRAQPSVAPAEPVAAAPAVAAPASADDWFGIAATALQQVAVAVGAAPEPVAVVGATGTTPGAGAPGAGGQGDWMSEAVSVVSENVRSIVGGTPAGTPVAAATPRAAATGSAATAAPSGHLVAEDGLSGLVAAAERQRAAPSGAAEAAPVITAAAPQAPAPRATRDRAWTNTASDWVSTGASIVTGNTAPAPERPARATAAPPPAARPAPPPAPTAAPAPAAPAALASAAPVGGTAAGEPGTQGWRDQGQGVDLLAEEEVALELGSDDDGAATDLFDIPGTEARAEAPADEMEALNTLLVQVRLDGGSVPIEIDGKEAGSVPGALQLSPGVHTVTLYNRGVASTFRLEAVTDPDEWCFESKGRNFRPVRCR